MELFFAKSSIVDIWLGSKYSSVKNFTTFPRKTPATVYFFAKLLLYGLKLYSKEGSVVGDFLELFLTF